MWPCPTTTRASTSCGGSNGIAIEVRALRDAGYEAVARSEVLPARDRAWLAGFALRASMRA